ncbi:hypothetical protein FRC06_005270, partial [Ceratobasidium sp. 370]
MDESSDYGYDSEGCSELAYSCPCCSQKLSQHQIDWHLDELVDQIVLSSLDAKMSNNEGSNAGDLSMAANDTGPGSVEALSASNNISKDQVPEQVPIDILNYVDPVILPLLNPNRDEASEANDEASEANDKASGANNEGSIIHDKAPEYVEQEVPPGLNPDDEADLADDELHILFDENMEDLEDHEWIEL